MSRRLTYVIIFSLLFVNFASSCSIQDQAQQEPQVLSTDIENEAEASPQATKASAGEESDEPYPKPGNYFDAISSGEIDRVYKVHIPPSYTREMSIPLVINFHGRTSNAFDQEMISQFSKLSDSEGFVVVYPQATGMPATWEDLPVESKVNDVLFIQDLILYLQEHINIDAKRIYATGLSNGGAMANRLGCDLSDKIAAIAPVAGAYYFWDQCEPSRAVPVAVIHGTIDEVIPYEGAQSEEFADLPPIVDFSAMWAERNGCDPESERSSRAGIIFKDLWSNCTDGADVVLYSQIGGGHAWPTFDEYEESSNLNDVIWAFFEAHPMP